MDSDRSAKSIAACFIKQLFSHEKIFKDDSLIRLWLMQNYSTNWYQLKEIQYGNRFSRLAFDRKELFSENFLSCFTT